MSQRPQRSGATRKKQPVKHRWPKMPQINVHPKVWLFGLGLVLIAGTASLLSFGAGHLRWELKDVQFDQVLIYQDRTLLANVLDAQVGKNLMQIGIEDVKAEIEALPWIASAEVKLLWPGILQVEVLEERPIAVWNESQLISQTGKLFIADATQFELPDLYGSDGSMERVMSHYLNFNRSLIGYGELINSLRLTSGGSWTIATESGFKIHLGSEDVLARFKRTLGFMGRVQTSVDKIEYIDARYNNGIAYKLKQINGDKAA